MFCSCVVQAYFSAGVILENVGVYLAWLSRGLFSLEVSCLVIVYCIRGGNISLLRLLGSTQSINNSRFHLTVA